MKQFGPMFWKDAFLNRNLLFAIFGFLVAAPKVKAHLPFQQESGQVRLFGLEGGLVIVASLVIAQEFIAQQRLNGTIGSLAALSVSRSSIVFIKTLEIVLLACLAVAVAVLGLSISGIAPTGALSFGEIALPISIGLASVASCFAFSVAPKNSKSFLPFVMLFMLLLAISLGLSKMGKFVQNIPSPSLTVFAITCFVVSIAVAGRLWSRATEPTA